MTENLLSSYSPERDPDFISLGSTTGFSSNEKSKKKKEERKKGEREKERESGPASIENAGSG